MKNYYLLITIIFLVGCSSSSKRLERIPKLNLTLEQKLERANLAYEEARLDHAESLYLQITKDKPKLREPWLKLGNIYMRQTRMKAAIRCFEEAIRLDKEDGRAWYNLALAKVKQATMILETAEQVIPKNSVYQTYISSLHQRLIEKVKRK